MNEFSKKRKLSMDVDEDTNLQCKKVNFIDAKENFPQNEIGNEFDFPDMDFDFLEVFV